MKLYFFSVLRCQHLAGFVLLLPSSDRFGFNRKPKFRFYEMTEILSSFPLIVRFLVRNNFWLFELLRSCRTLNKQPKIEMKKKNLAEFVFNTHFSVTMFPKPRNGVERKFSMIFFMMMFQSFSTFQKSKKPKIVSNQIPNY